MKVTFLQKRGSDGITMKVLFLELEQHLKRYLESLNFSMLGLSSLCVVIIRVS